MRLGAVRLVTADVAGLARFYEAITRVASVGSDEYVELRVPGATVSICSAVAVRVFGGVEALPGTNRSVILDFEVDDVDAERARLDGVVADWVQQPTTQPWGNRSMLLRDPDGNLVGLFARALNGARPTRRTRPWRV